MADLSGASSAIDLKLGQSPNTKIPALNYELQGIYNALHILSQYLYSLRLSLEGDDSAPPSENFRFLKFFTATAKQAITAGQIVTTAYDGELIKGTSVGVPVVKNFSGNAYLSGMIQNFFGVALTDGAIGETVRVGIGPGILKVTGATCGQVVYAGGAYGQAYSVPRDGLLFYDQPYSGDGNIYLGNPQIQRLPGYPQDVSSTLRILGHYLFSPIGVAVANDYVLFSDFLFWEGRVANSVFELYP